MNKNLLANIKEKYENNENIIKYLKNLEGRSINSFEDIMLSYDFQAGTYVEEYKKIQKKEKFILRYKEMAEVIGYCLSGIESATILEAGCGEATTLAEIYTQIGVDKVGKFYGLDASYSRLMVAQNFLENERKILDVNYIMGDMKNIPIADSACDIVYTVHSCEPNGGNERAILEELFRVTKKYLILFEPAYDFASEDAKRRMVEHGYVTKLIDTIYDMGLDVKEHRLLEHQVYDLNPTGVTIIQKHSGTFTVNDILADPISKKNLRKVENLLWCEESMLIYPIMRNIMCLLEDNAVVATKFGMYL